MSEPDKEFEHLGYKVEIHVEQDTYHGPPWKENDGHGPVSEWRRKESKTLGERVLCQDRGSCRFYDWQEAMKIARKDGWGLGDERKAALTKKLGRPPTHGEVLEAAVQFDFDYLHGWCNDEWHWVGYTTRIKAPDGTRTDGDSCWGFDDEDYMLKEAESQARHEVERLIKVAAETQLAECYP